MPIYEYACSACDHRADILHGINDPGPKFCPSCGAEDTMKKMFSAPTIHFKGSGWAKKDRSATSRSKKDDTKADGDRGDKSADKSDKGEKSDKAEKGDKSDKGDKSGSSSSDSSAKADKPASGSGSSSASSGD